MKHINLRKVSIITVVLNSVNQIEKTIKSIVNLTYQNIEYIIIDGGSTDNTIEIIRNYDPFIKYWVSEPDAGLYDAMNKGAMKSSGSVLLYLNAGDILINEGFNSLVYNLNSIEKICLDKTVLYGINTWRSNVNVGCRFLPNFLPLLGRLPSHQTMLIPRNLQLEAPYDTNFPICADQDFKIKLYKKGINFKHLPFIVTESLPGGVSQRVLDMRQLYDRSIETYKVFKKNFFSIWALLYTSLFFIWNIRKLF